MTRFFLVLALVAAAFLSACGTAPANNAATSTSTGSGTGVASASQPEPAIVKAQVVRVPPASTRKVVLNMTGPKTVTEAKDWASFKEEWRATFAEYAKERGIVFAVQEGDARSLGEPGTLLNVYVNDYRQVGIGARIFLGVMTGNAYIDAKVAFSDLNGGQRFGDQAYNTTSSAWAGVFGKMTPQQVDAIGAEIFSSIKPR